MLLFLFIVNQMILEILLHIYMYMVMYVNVYDIIDFNVKSGFKTKYIPKIELELGVPRNTCVTCRALSVKGNISKRIEGRGMTSVQCISSYTGLSVCEEHVST